MQLDTNATMVPVLTALMIQSIKAIIESKAPTPCDIELINSSPNVYLGRVILSFFMVLITSFLIHYLLAHSLLPTKCFPVHCLIMALAQEFATWKILFHK